MEGTVGIAARHSHRPQKCGRLMAGPKRDLVKDSAHLPGGAVQGGRGAVALPLCHPNALRHCSSVASPRRHVLRQSPSVRDGADTSTRTPPPPPCVQEPPCARTNPWFRGQTLASLFFPG